MLGFTLLLQISGVQVEMMMIKNVNLHSILIRRQHSQEVVTEMCVVIQEMVQSELAGVIFTSDPVTGDFCTKK